MAHEPARNPYQEGTPQAESGRENTRLASQSEKFLCEESAGRFR